MSPSFMERVEALDEVRPLVVQVDARRPEKATAAGARHKAATMAENLAILTFDVV